MNWWLWLIVFWVIGLTLVGGAIILACSFDWYDGGDVVVGTVVVVVGIALFITTLMFCINAINRHQNAVSCHNWGIYNNRPVRWVSYNWWTYDCTTPDGRGHWIPTNQLIVNVPDTSTAGR